MRLRNLFAVVGALGLVANAAFAQTEGYLSAFVDSSSNDGSVIHVALDVDSNEMPVDGQGYAILVGMSGSEPGTKFAGLYVPLNFDALTDLMWRVAFLQSEVAKGLIGRLDGNGHAEAQILVPAQLEDYFLGVQFYFAALGTDSPWVSRGTTVDFGGPDRAFVLFPDTDRPGAGGGGSIGPEPRVPVEEKFPTSDVAPEPTSDAAPAEPTADAAGRAVLPRPEYRFPGSIGPEPRVPVEEKVPTSDVAPEPTSDVAPAEPTADAAGRAVLGSSKPTSDEAPAEEPTSDVAGRIPRLPDADVAPAEPTADAAGRAVLGSSKPTSDEAPAEDPTEDVAPRKPRLPDSDVAPAEPTADVAGRN